MDKETIEEMKLARTFESPTSSGFGVLAEEFGLSKLEVLKKADEIRHRDPRVIYQTPSLDTKKLYLEENLNAEFVEHTKELNKLYFEKLMTENKITLILIEKLEKRSNKKISKELEEAFKPETLLKDTLIFSACTNTNDKRFQEFLKWVKS